MTQKSLELKQLFEAKIAAVTQTAEVEQLRIEFLGKKGSVAALMQELRNVPNDQKKEAGQIINETKQFIEGAIAAKIVELKALEELIAKTTDDIKLSKLKVKKSDIEKDIAKPLEARDFNATIILMLLTPQGMLTAHIGDGRMGYKAQDGSW
jgi:phenylalanyl-tRNA synthetase alpha subunit